MTTMSPVRDVSEALSHPFHRTPRGLLLHQVGYMDSREKVTAVLVPKDTTSILIYRYNTLKCDTR